ncbi:hypothetical protein FE257_011737 [Aspergillus nanangensis]|uniref:Transmembrane protein n=1 Tax=Aspergillus nanangensis TaxID=2582783 RepID=A0AAD4GXU5_ASPNN|nr:hypothetical protein FE257_011737 [Aspergillus nanangensis]
MSLASSRRHEPPEINRDYHEISQDASEDALRLEKAFLTRDAVEIIPPSGRARRWAPLFITFVYLFLMLFFWVVTATLCFQPIKGDKWYTSYSEIGPCHVDDSGSGFGFTCIDLQKTMLREALTANDRWRRTARILGSLMSVLAIPVSSAICARGAVAYVQNQKRTFAFSKAMALADRGWWDPTIAGKMLMPSGRRRYTSHYLLFAACICAFGALIWPLQEILLTQTSVQLIVRDDNSVSPRTYMPDADITGLSQVNLTDAVIATVGSLESAGYWDSQPNIWRSPGDMCNSSSNSWTFSCVAAGPGVDYYNLLGNSTFVSNIVNSVDTGLVENHALRFNSSVHCVNVDDTSYPRPCGGFATSSITTPGDGGEEQIFEVCAPADMGRFPWNVTRNRQELKEEVYIHFNAAAASFLTNGTTSSSLTQRCTSQTTAGYFMLPNNVNHTFGPLQTEFDLIASNDPETSFPPYGRGYAVPPDDIVLGKAYPIPKPPEAPALGPLLTATISLFGPRTFFSTRANTTTNTTDASVDPQNCDPVPLSYIGSTDGSGNMPSRESSPMQRLSTCASASKSAYSSDLNAWLLDLFLDSDALYPETVFTQAMFFANKANLARAASVRPYRRTIVIDQGIAAQLLSMPIAGVAVLSAVVVLHLVGLVMVAGYTVRWPTWTATLDAFAVLNLGRRLGDRELTSMSSSREGLTRSVN